jgi:serine protease
MKPTLLKPLIHLTLALLAGVAGAAPVAPRLPSAALAPVEGEVIVKFRADAATPRKFALAAGTATRADAATVQAMLTSRASALGARVGRALVAGSAAGERAQVMRASGVDAATLAALLAADPEVEYAVPNGRLRILSAPNDPLYAAAAAGVRLNGPDSGQWYLRAPDATIKSAIDIETAWLRSTGSGVVVAVLDTGVRPEHPDLAGQLLPGYDFVSNATVANDSTGRDADATDPGDWLTSGEAGTGVFAGCSAASSSWHGTSTSSLVAAAANNSLGMAGSAPGAKVLPVRVLGKCYGDDADIIAGMLWAAGLTVDGVPGNPNPARVINMSLGGGGACNAAYQDAVNRIAAAGTVIVAAAGNSAGGPVGTPANCDGVVGVLALRHAGSKVGFSDLGPQISIAAPGGNCINITVGSPCLYPILAATNAGTQGPVGSGWTDSYDISVGTSFSSPLVAGVAALMVAQQPALTPAQLRTTLQSTARPFPTTGADNGPDDPTPVTQCHAPTTGVDQLQCYCNTTYCGAGMLDAGAAVAAVAGPLARIDLGPGTATAGRVVELSGINSSMALGRTLSSYAWLISSGGGIVSAFNTATNAATASLTPSAAGSFTVQLTVTDNTGASNVATRTVTVAAAPVVEPPAPASSGGGGAASLWWVLGVLTAAVALRRTAPRLR